MPPRGPKGQTIGHVPPRSGKIRQAQRKQGANGGQAASGSTLMVRNLPLDVKLADVTELFSVTIGPLSKPVEMFFDEKAEFNGTAIVHFRDADSAGKAWEMFHQKLVDNKTTLYLYIILSSPPARLVPVGQGPSPVIQAPGTPASSLANLAPFPSQQRKPKPAKKPTPLAQRLGPSPVPLASRLGKVAGQQKLGVANGSNKKVLIGAGANLKKKAPGAGKKKRSGAAAKAARMDVD